jgi:hypothetical protein
MNVFCWHILLARAGPLAQRKGLSKQTASGKQSYLPTTTIVRMLELDSDALGLALRATTCPCDRLPRYLRSLYSGHSTFTQVHLKLSLSTAGASIELQA